MVHCEVPVPSLDMAPLGFYGQLTEYTEPGSTVVVLNNSTRYYRPTKPCFLRNRELGNRGVNEEVRVSGAAVRFRAGSSWLSPVRGEIEHLRSMQKVELRTTVEICWKRREKLRARMQMDELAPRTPCNGSKARQG